VTGAGLDGLLGPDRLERAAMRAAPPLPRLPLPLLLLLPAAAAQRQWLDAKPHSAECLALVYRFSALEPAQACAPLGASADGLDARPYYRDTTASDTAWLASNTTMLCASAERGSAALADAPGAVWVGCGAKKYALAWWPLHLLLAQNGMAANAAAATDGYLVAWAAGDAPLPARVNVTRAEHAALTFCAGALCETFTRGAYQDTYPQQGIHHAPAARQAGMALRWPHSQQDARSYHAEARRATADANANRDAAGGARPPAEPVGAKTVGQRINAMRRMYAALS
jgi:hypothetical protein